MTTETKCNSKVRIDWRENGRLGYRETDLNEIREWARKDEAVLSSGDTDDIQFAIGVDRNRNLTVYTSAGNLVLQEGRIYLPNPHGDRWIGAGDNELCLPLFVATAERLEAGESWQHIFESHGEG